MEQTEKKRGCGATGVNACETTEVKQKNARQFTQGQNIGKKARGAHFATRGLEPLPVNASTGSTTQNKRAKPTRYLSQAERRTKVRLGHTDSAVNTVDEQASAACRITWHWCLHCVACCGWTSGTGHHTRHNQTKVTGRKTVLQWQYFKENRTTYWAGHPAFEDLAARIAPYSARHWICGRLCPGCQKCEGTVRL